MSKKFNFFENIFELSETKNKEDLPNEWEFIIRHESIKKSKLCICNCKIKNYSIFVNKLNKHFIHCGDCCRKQLNLKYSNENIIFRLFNQETIYSKQQYEIIKDIFKYSQEVIYNLINSLDNMKYHRLHKMKDLVNYMIENKEEIILDNNIKYTLINLSKKMNWYENKLDERRNNQEQEIQKIKEKQEIQKQLIEQQKQERSFQEQKQQQMKAIEEQNEQKIKEELNKNLFIKYHTYLSNILEEHEYIKQSNTRQIYKFSDQYKTKEKALLAIEKIFVTHYNKFISSFDINRYVSWHKKNFEDENFSCCYIKETFFEKYNKQYYQIDDLMNLRNKLYCECKDIIETYNKQLV
jgi:hypothetical protein